MTPKSRATPGYGPPYWWKAPASGCSSTADPTFASNCLLPACGTLSAVLITHEHGDHVHGIDELRPVSQKLVARCRSTAARTSSRSCARGSRTRLKAVISIRP